MTIKQFFLWAVIGAMAISVFGLFMKPMTFFYLVAGTYFCWQSLNILTALRKKQLQVKDLTIYIIPFFGGNAAILGLAKLFGNQNSIIMLLLWSAIFSISAIGVYTNLNGKHTNQKSA